MSVDSFPNYIIASFKCDKCGCGSFVLNRDPNAELSFEELKQYSTCANCRKPMKRLPVEPGKKYMEDM